MRSPSFRIVFAFATFPFTVVTPDSSAYLCGESLFKRKRMNERMNAHSIPWNDPGTLLTPLQAILFQSIFVLSSWYTGTNTEGFS